MASATTSTAPEDSGVFFLWLNNIDNHTDDADAYTGVELRYECSGVIAHIILSLQDLKTEDNSESAITQLMERHQKTQEWFTDEPEPSQEEADAVENEIEQFIHKICSPTLQTLVPADFESYDPKCLPDNLERYMYPKSVNLQVTVTNGIPQVIRRDDLPPYNDYLAVPAVPLQKTELPSYSPS